MIYVDYQHNYVNNMLSKVLVISFMSIMLIFSLLFHGKKNINKYLLYIYIGKLKTNIFKIAFTYFILIYFLYF